VVAFRTVQIGIVLRTGITAIPVRDRITDNPCRGPIAVGPVHDRVTDNHGRVRMNSINGRDHMRYNHSRTGMAVMPVLNTIPI
jgi:hypothetical protein